MKAVRLIKGSEEDCFDLFVRWHSKRIQPSKLIFAELPGVPCLQICVLNIEILKRMRKLFKQRRLAPSTYFEDVKERFGWT